MKLARLIEGIEPLRVEGSLDVEIGGICYDSRQVESGCLFVALRGSRSDGHHFIEQAVAGGAAALLLEQPYMKTRVPQVQVRDSRAAMARLAAVFHRQPAAKLRMTGVTGTNGKTTTTFMLKHILEAAFLRAALIGTVRYEIGERILPATHTTPECVDIQRLLQTGVDSGCRSAVMEVSSHALEQGRVAGIEFDVGVFTNLSQDHLDYHGSMGEYFRAKQRLFLQMTGQRIKDGHAVVNGDDSYGVRLAKSLRGKLPVSTFGFGAACTLRATDARNEHGRTVFKLAEEGGREFLVRSPFAGRFNVYNALAALAAARALGLDLRAAVKALAEAPQAPGRLEAVPARRNFQVYVDYAHTPDALENALATLRELSPRRLLVVFGCGGDRDKAKRKPMAEAVERAADFAIITSDNPRNEDPLEIIGQIRAGFVGEAWMVIEDRKDAIYKAIELAGEGDVVLIAGKGHETYQEVGGQRYPFSDVEVAGWALADRQPQF